MPLLGCVHQAPENSTSVPTLTQRDISAFQDISRSVHDRSLTVSLGHAQRIEDRTDFSGAVYLVKKAGLKETAFVPDQSSFDLGEDWNCAIAFEGRGNSLAVASGPDRFAVVAKNVSANTSLECRKAPGKDELASDYICAFAGPDQTVKRTKVPGPQTMKQEIGEMCAALKPEY